MYLIADTHLKHKNIIGFCQRPFADVNEMDKEIVRRWNSVILDNETLILHLGDVGFHYASLQEVIPLLNGKKDLVLGNHDWGVDRMSALGFRCRTAHRNDTYEFEWFGVHFVVAHRPRDLPVWEPGDDRVRLCGHEHNNMPHFIKWWRDGKDQAHPVMALNISCEYTDYTPIHIDECIYRWKAFMKAVKV